MAKRITPPEEEDRLMERINTQFHNYIIDKTTYEKAFSNITDLDENNITNKQKEMRQRIFDNLRNKYPKIKPYSAHEKAKGENFNKDAKTTENVVYDQKDYKNAKTQDLKGYDTKQPFNQKGQLIVKKSNFNTLGFQKGRIVYTVKTTVQVKGKERIRYRAKNGRFATKRKN